MLRKKNRPCCRARAFIWENFQPCYRGHTRKTRDLGNRAGPAFHDLIEFFYTMKSGEARPRKLSQPGWPGSYQEALIVCQWENQSKLYSSKKRFRFNLTQMADWVGE